MKVVYTILLLLWIALGTYFSNAKLCGKKAKPTATATSATGAAAAKGSTCDISLIFNDGDGLNITAKENFKFGPNASVFLNDKVADSIEKVLRRVAGYLEENPDRALQITGHYHKNEGTPKSFENLGLARSARIKNYLVNDLGIAENQLLTSSEKLGSSCYDSDKVLKKGATMTFGEKK